MSNRINFTKAALSKIKCPKGKNSIYVYDTQVRGLCLRIMSSGVKTYVYYKKIAGKPERVNIGRYEDISVQEVRGICSQYNSSIVKGKNPKRAGIGNKNANVQASIKKQQELTFISA